MAFRRRYSPVRIRCPEGITLLGRDFARAVLDGIARDFPQRLAPITEQIDPLCLEKACVQTIRQLYYEVAIAADQYDVPGDVLWDVLIHWIVSDHMGWDRTPLHFFVAEKES